MDNLSRDKIIKYLIASSIFTVSSSVYSAAFMLHEQNTSGLGNAYAGRTAVADDASTSFYNPAGLVMMKNHQALVSVVNPLVNFDVKARSVTSSSAAVPAGRAVTQGDPTDHPGKYVPIPAVHFAGRLTPCTYYGLSVTAPFGLTTEYSRFALTRYFATKSDLKVIDINPNIGFNLTPQWSLGVGVSAQYAKAILNSQIDTRVLLGAPQNIDLDAQGHNSADGWGYGYNFGLLYQPTVNTRLGMAFRSKVKHDVDGKLKVSGPPGALPAPLLAAGLVDQKVHASVTLPEALSFSSFQTLNSEWDLMGDITLTNWHRFKKLVLHYPDTPLDDVRVEERFKDTIKVALGANYKYNKRMMFKVGTAFDDSPVRSKHRTYRVPDFDRYWLSAGVKYVMSPSMVFDLGYTHVFVKSGTINESKLATPNTRAVSSSKGSIDLIGFQASYTLG